MKMDKSRLVMGEFPLNGLWVVVVSEGKKGWKPKFYRKDFNYTKILVTMGLLFLYCLMKTVKVRIPPEAFAETEILG